MSWAAASVTIPSGCSDGIPNASSLFSRVAGMSTVFFVKPFIRNGTWLHTFRSTVDLANPSKACPTLIRLIGIVGRFFSWNIPLLVKMKC